jgi:hypothetical protein
MSPLQVLASHAIFLIVVIFIPFSLGRIVFEGLEKATRGGWMRANQNSLREVGLYPELDPTPLSSNSVKTA